MDCCFRTDQDLRFQCFGGYIVHPFEVIEIEFSSFSVEVLRMESFERV